MARVQPDNPRNVPNKMSTTNKDVVKENNVEEDEAKWSMKVMVNKTKTKVLFALVDNYLAYILLSFLVFPLGVITQILRKYCGNVKVGSVNTLFEGLENLDSSHFRTELDKLMLLIPLDTLMEHNPVKYFQCEDPDCIHGRIILSMYPDTERCACGKLMNQKLESYNYQDDDGSTLKTSFLISDDLRMLPNVNVSILQSIKDLGITDLDGAEQITVTIGFNEVMDLFKWSLLSQTPLTDFILRKNHIMPNFPIPKYTPLTLTTQTDKEIARSKKFVVKAMIQKSTNKLLFVEADDDFVDFIFSFLIIPLGQVENLLGSNTSLGRIDNLYKSLENLNADKYFKKPYIKDCLLIPAVPPNYLSKNQIFPIREEFGNYQLTFANPNKEVSYIKGPGMFMVTDDLTVTPLCMISALSTLNELKIPFSDVNELWIDIGLEEGLCILKASLTSTSALTNGLSHIFRKRRKQEH